MLRFDKGIQQKKGIVEARIKASECMTKSVWNHDQINCRVSGTFENVLVEVEFGGHIW